MIHSKTLYHSQVVLSSSNQSKYLPGSAAMQKSGQVQFLIRFSAVSRSLHNGGTDRYTANLRAACLFKHFRTFAERAAGCNNVVNNQDVFACYK